MSERARRQRYTEDLALEVGALRTEVTRLLEELDEAQAAIKLMRLAYDAEKSAGARLREREKAAMVVVEAVVDLRDDKENDAASRLWADNVLRGYAALTPSEPAVDAKEDEPCHHPFHGKRIHVCPSYMKPERKEEP